MAQSTPTVSLLVFFALVFLAPVSLDLASFALRSPNRARKPVITPNRWQRTLIHGCGCCTILDYRTVLERGAPRGPPCLLKGLHLDPARPQWTRHFSPNALLVCGSAKLPRQTCSSSLRNVLH